MDNRRPVFNVTIEVAVLDEEKLLAAATAHVRQTSGDQEAVIDDCENALTVMLDPGDGGAAYAGRLEDAGIQAIASHCDMQQNLDIVYGNEDAPSPFG